MFLDFGFYPWGWGYYPWVWSYYDSHPRRYYYDSYDSSYSMVAEVQAALANLGFYSGRVDGINGPLTRDAIRRYQANNDLPVTGRIDRNLIDSLGIG